MQFGRTLAAAVVWAGIASSALWAQTGAIEGQVKGPDGKGMVGAMVYIERTDIKGNYKVKTNKKGEFFHAGLPLGTYIVKLEVEGKIVDQVGGVRTRLGDPVPVNFDLAAMAAKQQAMQKAAETGKITEEMSKEMSAEQKAAFEKANKERQAQMAKNKALNDAFNGGMTARQAGQFDEAIAQFTKALELDNGGANQLTILAQLADTQMAKANALKAGPEFETAMNASLETYAKVIAAKPDDVNAINNYALGLARVKKYDQAQQELEKAAALDPPSAGKYFYNLGAILTNAGQSEPACKAFKRAIEGDANYADAQYQWGICLTGQAKTKPDGTIEFPPGTREAFEKYMALKPDGQFAESAKGMIQSLGGKVETEYRNPAAAPAKKAVKKK